MVRIFEFVHFFTKLLKTYGTCKKFDVSQIDFFSFLTWDIAEVFDYTCFLIEVFGRCRGDKCSFWNVEKFESTPDNIRTQVWKFGIFLLQATKSQR